MKIEFLRNLNSHYRLVFCARRCVFNYEKREQLARQFSGLISRFSSIVALSKMRNSRQGIRKFEFIRHEEERERERKEKSFFERHIFAENFTFPDLARHPKGSRSSSTPLRSGPPATLFPSILRKLHLKIDEYDALIC